MVSTVAKLRLAADSLTVMRFNQTRFMRPIPEIPEATVPRLQRLPEAFVSKLRLKAAGRGDELGGIVIELDRDKTNGYENG